MEKMTKKELKSIIEEAVRNWGIDIEHVDREDAMRILNDIEQADDTVCYDLIADADAHPIAIQTFTNIRFKESNYNVILNFNLELYGNINQWTDNLYCEYVNAYKNQQIFNS